MEHATPRLPVAILIPARDEKTVLPETLAAAVACPAAEVVVVDDDSRDGTAAVIRAWSQRDARVRGLPAGPLPPGWTGKNHALWRGVSLTSQPWLLFLDADTRLLPGGLEAAFQWARQHHLDALSLSPSQDAVHIWEQAVQPYIFRLLSRKFQFDEINDPDHPAAAANGQFILIRREVYDAVGGHAAVRGEVLEDVALAGRVKQAGFRLQFRSGAGWVRARMYRNFAGLWQGWSKNLYLLFGPPWRRARVLACLLPLPVLLLAGAALLLRWWTVGLLLAGIIAIAHLRYAAALHRGGWRGARYLIPGSALTGLLWLHSERLYRRAQSVQWKGRAIAVASASPAAEGIGASAASASSSSD